MKGLGLEFYPFIYVIEEWNAPIESDDLFALLISEDAQMKMDPLLVNNVVPSSIHIATHSPSHACNASKGHGYSIAVSYDFHDFGNTSCGSLDIYTETNKTIP